MANGTNAPKLQVYEVLDRLEAITITATKLPLTNRCVVNPAEMADLLGRLRRSLPTDLTEAQQILRHRDAIVTRAHAEAKRIREHAEQDAMSKVGQTTVMREAQKVATNVQGTAEQRARETLTRAEAQAKARIADADAYAAEVLRKLEGELATLIATARRGLDVLKSGKPLDGSGPR